MDDWRHFFSELRPPGKLFAGLHEGRVIIRNGPNALIWDSDDTLASVTPRQIRLQEFWYKGITRDEAVRHVREKLLEADGNG